MKTFETTRRSFLATLLAVVPGAWAAAMFAASARGETAAQTTSPVGGATEEEGPFRLAPLPYAYNALEPYIDEQTMRLHHDKHHAGYVKNLNAAVKGHPQLARKSVEELLRDRDSLPEEVREAIRNHGGGHMNHSMFWEIMTPGGSKKPTGELAAAIDKAFGSFEEFKKKFEQAGEKRFGSGWAWLVKGKDGKLQVISTANQDNPISEGLFPIMGNDVWEHAYYLKYQNRRGEYLKAWWNVLNWDKVAERFSQAGTANRAGKAA